MFQNQSIPRVSRLLMLKCHLLWEAFGDLPLPQAHELLPLLPLALASVLLLSTQQSEAECVHIHLFL